MPILLDNKKRIIIPRWRNIYNKSSSIVLNSEQGSDKPSLEFEENFTEKKKDFGTTKNFSNALEVVNAAFSIGRINDAKEEAGFIRSLKRNMPEALKKIIQQILQLDSDLINETKISDPLLSNIFKESGKKITYIKNRIRKFYFNPLLWLELSRLYSILGYLDKAEAASQVALQLSSNSNRLITRSVSRFYIYKKDFAKAQSIVRSSPLFKYDPWLIACDISYSQTQKRRANSFKMGMNMIEGRNFSKHDLTELAAALGTEKFLNDKSKEARSLFKLALLEPNDNSFAQAEYFLREMAEDSNLIDKIPNNYEAHALDLFSKKNYIDSFKHSFNWLIDQPFSRRAAYFNSYLLSGILEMHDKGIEVAKFSLKSNPESFLLNNNIAFSYAAIDDIKHAKVFIKKARQNASEPFESVILSATEGMILFREGRKQNDIAKIDRGRDYYRRAATEARNQKNRSLEILAVINLAREEYLANSINTEQVETMLSQINKHDLESESIERSVQALKRLLKAKK